MFSLLIERLPFFAAIFITPKFHILSFYGFKYRIFLSMKYLNTLISKCQ